MGREAYLAKIAFGRSAFLHSQETSQSEHYVQLASSQADLPAQYQNFNGNNYVQLYDERGNPMNPRSHEYGKRLRNAQNDVLAAVGVVERRQSPDVALPGSYAARLEELEDEDTVGNVLALTVPLTQQLCLWWIGVVRHRVLAFSYPDSMPLSRIIASELTQSGSSILYAGALATVLSAICTQTIVYSAFVYRPIERLVLTLAPSSQARKIVRRSKGLLHFGLRVAVELFFYPFSYHAELQRLGLIPARPLLPSWSSFVPLSLASPLLPLSIYYSPAESLMDFAKAVLTSPVLFVCVTQLYEHWVFSSINEAIESSIIQPDNPDIKGRNIDDEHRASTILGLRRESPPAVREFINKVLTAFGWGMPYADSGIDGQGDSQAPQPVRLTHLDRGVTTIESITPLVIPVLRTRAEHEHEDVTPGSLPTVLDGRNDTDRPTTPPTPRIFEFQDGDDPRIRITNRNDIVEMEVRLPPRVLSSHTELAETSTTESRLHQTAQTQNTSVPRNRPKHRVSQLSIESSRLLGTLVKGQCVSFALLPFKFVFLRLIASHYLGRSHELLHSRTVMPLPGLRDLTWGSVGTQISRVALCSALQVSIDLGLWGLQYFTAVRIGKGVFGWGTL